MVSIGNSVVETSRATKLTLYKVLPVLLYGAEAWTLSSTDAAALGVFERKVLCKIFGPVRVGDLLISLFWFTRSTAYNTS